MPQVPIHRRGVGVIAHALVDEDDYERIASQHWGLDTKGYPLATRGVPRLSMHRAVLGLTPGDGLEVDHINRNPLDNRRANLRLATDAENKQNYPSRRGSASQYRGVTWSKAAQKWQASGKLNGKQTYLGQFEDEREAARAAAAWRAEHMPYAVEDPALTGDAE